MYNATIFCNTGFNAVNIPDSPATLNLAQAQYTVPALDIYQARELSQFVVRANYGVVKNADYLYLVNSEDSTDFAYYSIQNVTMTSKDTAVLDVTMDYILTAGGVSNLTFLDGMCERHHVAVADDTFGAYDEDDPYISPAQQMLIESEVPNFVGSGEVDTDVTILESTVNLYAMYKQSTDQNLNPEGIDYTSADGNVVTVPNVAPGQPASLASMGTGTGASDEYTCLIPNSTFYIPDWDNSSYIFTRPTGGSVETAQWIPDVLSFIRSLGVESCIIAQYSIPAFMLSGTEISGLSGYSAIDPTTGTPSIEMKAVGLVNKLKGKFMHVQSTLSFEHGYSHNVQNKRLFYGKNCEYKIISVASGNSATFLPEDIRSGSEGAPAIAMRVDPRPDGAPYFRFEYYKGGLSASDSFFINAVKGLTWQNVPLVFQGASGSLMNQYKFNAQQASLQEGANYGYKSAQLGNQQANLNATLGMAGNLISGVANGLTGNWGGVLGDAADFATAGMNLGFTNAQYELTKNHQENSFYIQRNSELQSLLIQNNVVAPSMNFPISESIRDFVGNTCLVYRTYYTENDVTRLDKILTMYGYRHTTPITTALLTNRSKFNYIQARGVSVGNTLLPKWIRDGIATQFAAGTRIWHQLPDVSAYTDGSNT